MQGLPAQRVVAEFREPRGPLRALNLTIEELTPQAAARRFPQIAFDSTITSVWWEPEAGYLFARRACEHVLERFIAEGGEYRQAAVRAPVQVGASTLRRVALDGAVPIEADASSPAGRGSDDCAPRSLARASRRRGRRSTTSVRLPGTRGFSIRRCRCGSTIAIG